MCPICQTATQVFLLPRRLENEQAWPWQVATATDHEPTSTALTSENPHRDWGKLRKYFSLFCSYFNHITLPGGVKLITKAETWKEMTQWQESGTSKPHFKEGQGSTATTLHRSTLAGADIHAQRRAQRSEHLQKKQNPKDTHMALAWQGNTGSYLHVCGHTGTGMFQDVCVLHLPETALTIKTLTRWLYDYYFLGHRERV